MRRYLTVNDYEARLLSERTGLSIGELAERVDALVVTLGGEGSVIHAGASTYAIPAVPPTAIVDPTGCGDAYRAGLLYGIAQRLGLAAHRTARVGARRDQDRVARRAEPRRRPRDRRPDFRQGFR